MADSKKYDGNTWEHSLRKLTTATDTITTLPADVYADGNSATVGLVGNMTQTGTPTPTTPIQPQETGERTGNLFDKNDVLQNYRIGGDGAPFDDAMCAISGYIKVTSNAIVNQHKVFTFSNCMAEYDENKTFIIRHTTGTGKITTSASTKYIRVSVEKIRLDEAMVTMGATAPSSYEPYGVKIPISSANTTTPVYLGEVQTTRKIKKLVFDGTENWRQGVNGAMYLSPFTGESYKKEVAITSMNSHFAVQINTTSGTNQVGDNSSCFLAASGSAEYYIGARSYATVADFKAYLQQQYAAGTPVTIWYVLATPQTAVVNEPIRKIGDYADTVSGITIPTITGKDTFDVQTTLKPSEVELTYTGWHDASVREWDGSEWQ